MKASELRIGNYIFENDKQATVSMLYEYTKEGEGVNGFPERYEPDKYIYPKVEPIPLTEEWLVKFGFEYDEKECLYKILVNKKEEEYIYLASDEKFNYLKCGYKGEYYFHPSQHIQYVHQLQNLYFALTGEELTLTQ